MRYTQLRTFPTVDNPWPWLYGPGCPRGRVVRLSGGPDEGRAPALARREASSTYRFDLVSSGIDGRALRAARERAGLTQHQLARLLGVAGGERVSTWERGSADPTPATLRRAATELKVPLVDLVWFDGEVPDLRALRLRAGLDATSVAEAASVSPKTYWRWEAQGSSRGLPEATLQVLEGVLSVGRSELLAAVAASRPGS